MGSSVKAHGVVHVWIGAAGGRGLLILFSIEPPPEVKQRGGVEPRRSSPGLHKP